MPDRGRLGSLGQAPRARRRAAHRIGAWGIARVDYIDIERHMMLGRPEEAFRLADNMFETRSRGDFEPDDANLTGAALTSLVTRGWTSYTTSLAPSRCWAPTIFPLRST